MLENHLTNFRILISIKIFSLQPTNRIPAREGGKVSYLDIIKLFLARGLPLHSSNIFFAQKTFRFHLFCFRFTSHISRWIKFPPVCVESHLKESLIYLSPTLNHRIYPGALLFRTKLTVFKLHPSWFTRKFFFEYPLARGAT